MATHASVVFEKVRGNRVLRINAKRTFSPLYGQIVIYPQCQLIKQNVAIRAKAKNVSRDVRSIVGTTKRFDMAGLCVPACLR
jgi:hypothetical protein